MRPRWGLLWLLGAAASCLLEGSRGRENQLLANGKNCRKYSKRSKAGVATSGSGFGLKSEGSSPRIIRVSYSSANEVCPGLPLFSAEGYVDDQLLIHYESHTKKMHPRVHWVNTLEKDDPKFYNKYTQILQKDQVNFQKDVQMLQKRYNQSGGFHIVQMMIFCEVQEDGKRRGRWKYGYDGRNFLEYDMETDQWTTADKEAQGIKSEWECETAIKWRFIKYLESICLKWLQKNDRYVSKSFLRKERPVVVMSRRMEAEDGMETHVCRIHGFHPKDIDASWRRDGEVWEEETFRGFLAPNADGTYYYWISIRIDPKERDRYRCHVEHDSLPEPLNLELTGEKLQGGKG